MAERAYTESNQKLWGIILVEWTGLLLGDNGAPYKCPVHSDKTVQVTGTLGGATLAFQGSNDPAAAAANFGVLHRADAAATDLTFAAAEGVEPATPLENPLWVRPVVTGGDGTTNLTVRALLRKD